MVALGYCCLAAKANHWDMPNFVELYTRIANRLEWADVSEKQLADLEALLMNQAKSFGLLDLMDKVYGTDAALGKSAEADRDLGALMLKQLEGIIGPTLPAARAPLQLGPPEWAAALAECTARGGDA